MAQSSTLLRLLDSEGVGGKRNLPSVASVTFYETNTCNMDRAVKLLRGRVAEALQANRWLGSRFVDIEGRLTMQFLDAPDVDRHFEIQDNVEVSPCMYYSDLVDVVSPFLVKTGKACADKDEVLFRVTVLTNINLQLRGDGAAPELGEKEGIATLAAVVSLSHMLADGHTYYEVYRMLDLEDSSVPVFSMIPERVAGAEAAMLRAVDGEGGRALATPTFQQGVVADLPNKRKVSLNYIHPGWIQEQKARFAAQSPCGYVSSNDAVLCWFLTTSGHTLGYQALNMRGRLPPSLGLTSAHAGNYNQSLFYRDVDFASPALLRASLCGSGAKVAAPVATTASPSSPGATSEAKAADTVGPAVAGEEEEEEEEERVFRRATDSLPPQESELAQNDVAYLTSWATSYSPLRIPGCVQTLHLPLMLPPFLVADGCIAFVPLPGQLAVMTYLKGQPVAQRDAERGAAEGGAALAGCVMAFSADSEEQAPVLPRDIATTFSGGEGQPPAAAAPSNNND